MQKDVKMSNGLQLPVSLFFFFFCNLYLQIDLQRILILIHPQWTIHQDFLCYIGIRFHISHKSTCGPASRIDSLLFSELRTAWERRWLLVMQSINRSKWMSHWLHCCSCWVMSGMRMEHKRLKHCGTWRLRVTGLSTFSGSRTWCLLHPDQVHAPTSRKSHDPAHLQYSDTKALNLPFIRRRRSTIRYNRSEFDHTKTSHVANYHQWDCHRMSSQQNIANIF